MSKEQIAKVMESFTSDDLSSMENAYAAVYSTVLEAMLNGTAAEAKEQFSDFYEKEEQLAEIVGVMDAIDTKGEQEGTEQYWFGQIKALTDLLSEYTKQEQERLCFMELNRRSKYLNACLSIIDEHPRISGTELKQRLQIKDSNFSNFLKRMEPYQLFHVTKSGNTKYYILSPRGRRYLQNSTASQLQKHSRKLYDEAFLIRLLHYLANELKASDRPNASSVILQLNLHKSKSGSLTGNSQTIKLAINRVFQASEYRQRRKIRAMSSGERKGYRLDVSTSYSAYAPPESPKLIELTYAAGGLYE